MKLTKVIVSIHKDKCISKRIYFDVDEKDKTYKTSCVFLNKNFINKKNIGNISINKNDFGIIGSSICMTSDIDRTEAKIIKEINETLQYDLKNIKNKINSLTKNKLEIIKENR
jgi:hypothetical protein